MEPAAKTEEFQGLVKRLLLQVNYNPPTQNFAKTIDNVYKNIFHTCNKDFPSERITIG